MKPPRLCFYTSAFTALAVALSAPSASSQSTTAPAASAATSSAGAGTRESKASFRELDNVEGSWINLNVVPVRPLLAVGDALYAVNAHAGSVVRFNAGTSTPVQTIPVPWGPTALGRRTSSDELLVVCGGSHVLVRIDLASGITKSVLDLPSEPRDLLVDNATDKAFVSCAGADSVVQIDLATNQIEHTYTVRGKNPVFLSFDAQRRVLVAPQLSGNNSGAISQSPTVLSASGAGVVDFAASPQVVTGLPDEDLFRIDPVARTIDPVAKATGSVLFAHGLNPATGKFWQLNTDAINKDPARQTEASVRGDFVRNRVTITTLPATPGTPATQHAFVDLDDTDVNAPGVQFDVERTIGQPCAIVFGASGLAAVAGLLTDEVAILDLNGRVLRYIDLPQGTIPRGLQLDVLERFLYVYGWGTNKIEIYRLLTDLVHVGTLDIGFDPTPQKVKEGRELFYSARFSMHNNSSCASCHIEGRTDMLLWNLSDPLRDDKGPMITQTLAGIGRTGPLHWRGEKARLVDFNPAFDKLLGGAQLDATPGGQFEKFEAFVMSIQNAANPLQHPERVVADHGGLKPPAGFGVAAGSALRGQTAFFEGHQDGGAACNRCHALPTGTSGDITATSNLDPLPKRTHLKVPHFLEMWRKEQPIVPVTFLHSGTKPYPLLGAGLTHAGRSNSLFDFIDEIFRFVPDQEKADLLAFVSQIDQGLAPGVHRALLVARTTLPAAGERLQNYFVGQARERNIDLVVYGRADFGQGTVPMRWSWNRATGLFTPETALRAEVPVEFFVGQASSATGGPFVVVGVPVGMGRTFGIDSDGDDLFNADELRLGTDPFTVDFDGDGFSDGYEVAHASLPTDATSLPSDTTAPSVSNLRVQWVSARVASLAWETNEPTSFRIEAAVPGEPAHLVQGGDLERVRRVLVTGLTPSSGAQDSRIYGGTLRVADASGLATVVPLPAFRSMDFAEAISDLPGPGYTVVVADMKWESWVRPTPDTIQASALVKIERKIEAAGTRMASDQVVVASILKNGVRQHSFVTPLPQNFTVLGHAPSINGPFAMSLPSGADGVARLRFLLSGLAAGDKVEVVVEGVIPADPLTYDPTLPNFGSGFDPVPLAYWSFPDTAARKRVIALTY
ncbi:MAG: cytochrome c peroxidase [Planctomycetota bacterium]